MTKRLVANSAPLGVRFATCRGKMITCAKAKQVSWSCAVLAMVIFRSSSTAVKLGSRAHAFQLGTRFPLRLPFPPLSFLRSSSLERLPFALLKEVGRGRALFFGWKSLIDGEISESQDRILDYKEDLDYFGSNSFAHLFFGVMSFGIGAISVEESELAPLMLKECSISFSAARRTREKLR